MKGPLAGVAVVLLLLVCVLPIADRAPITPDASHPIITSTANTNTTSSVPATGYYAFLDPETGEFTDSGEPASIPLSPDLLGRIDTSDQDLVEETGTVSGVTVRLQGRFSSLAVSVVDEEGTAKVDCLSGLRVDTREVEQ